MEIQQDINLNGPEEFNTLKLIRVEELRAIRRIWVQEKHEFCDSVPSIYKEVTGMEFDDPDWISFDNFGSEEWEVLQSVCDRLYGEEELAFEMMYNLVDIENRAQGLNARKGILTDIEKAIGRTFYMNEDDATTYYSDRMNRKKQMGGKYNEKFLDYISEEDSEVEDVEE